ncbi:MAG: hypothetical protein OXH75_18100 [Acidobacteria bacterium]|nr:hypothetical protein [Acidobacteriota bacterium]
MSSDTVPRATPGGTVGLPGTGRQAEARRIVPLSLAAGFGVALAPALVLAALAFLPRVHQNATLLGTFLGAACVLGAWNVLLVVASLRRRDRGRPRSIELAPRAQHYLQACAQASVLLYWGWHWAPVYDAVPLIAGQLAFAYGFDLLLGWSRRDAHRVGFGPVPVVFSINLFLWFGDDWFYFQFVLVALGFAAKELLRWEREGRRVHIFNPASFPLAVFALALIATGTSGLTRGQDIAISQFYPPHMYLAIFLIALPGQYLFGVTTMTMAAVASTYVFGLLYFAATGVYFFYDSYIPIAVFLGMHLLFTDPSTAPRTELGRLLFGVLYGLSTVALYVLLDRAGAPTFYDKLLQVPLLNLSVIAIDRAVRSSPLRRLDPAALGRALAPRRRHLAYMGVWAVVFAAMSAAGGAGDRHPGQWLPFWQQACADGRPHACRYLAARQSGHCNSGSGWACNEAGILRAVLSESGGAGVDAGAAEARVEVALAFARGCELRFEPACANARAIVEEVAATFERAPPPLDDYPIILRGSKGPLTDRDPAALQARACRQGWPGACESVGAASRP